MEKQIVDFEAVAITDNHVAYASAYEFNGLFKADLVSEECTYISIFPDEMPEGKRIHSTAKQAGNRIYFVPASGTSLSIYDIEDNSITALRIPEPENKYAFYKPRFKFIDAIVFADYLWCIPSTYPGILRMDLSTNEMTVFDKWVPSEGYMFRGGLNLYHDKCYIPSGNNNVVLVFDLISQKGNVYHIGANNHGAMCMCGAEGKYWFAPRLKGSIVFWNVDKNEVKEYTKFPDEFMTQRIVFTKNFIYNNITYFVPASANNAIMVSTQMEDMEIEKKWKFRKDSMIERLFESDDYYYFREKCQSTEWDRHFKISKKDNTISDFLFTASVSERQKDEFLQAAAEQCVVIREDVVLSLENFINILVECRGDNI